MLLKRLVDFVLSLVALVVLSPVMAIIAILILVRDGRPILFSQRRSGLHGKPFLLRKYRTMSTESDDPTTDQQRITPLGAKLRATSLDELPTLLNVVRGEMSIVGPRPLPERYWGRYTDEQRRRLEVRPGVTGLAQVRGRNLLSWEERFELDVTYVEGRSLFSDLKLLVETVRAVVQREGIEAEDAVTMPEFWGSETSERTELEAGGR
jgi:lipopolysaccharide/colanic/teichoic acid biosynthesis glycosyltransferase